MSNPKEKARDLVKKYSKGKDEHGWFLCEFDSCAKQCALIAVDEMIEYHNSLFDKGFRDVHISLSSPIKTYNDILNPSLKYLQQVKQEIWLIT